MNYRVDGRNLKRKEIKDIKRKQAEERQAIYDCQPDEVKRQRNPKRYANG